MPPSGLLTPAQVVSNLTASVNPTSTDDHAHGYRVGSFWYNTATTVMWQCLVDTDNAAVWRALPLANSAARAQMSMIGNSSATTIAGANTPAKAAGTTTGSNLLNFTHLNTGATNRLTYDAGQPTLLFEINCHASLRAATINDQIGVVIRKNASTSAANNLIGTSSNSLTLVLLTASIQGVGATGFLSLAATDFIEVFVQNKTSGANIILVDLNLTIRVVL